MASTLKFQTGYDPADLHPWYDKSNYLKKGDAKYVQLIHTSTMLGTTLKTGDVDITVKHKSSVHFAENHFLGIQIQELIAIRSHVLVAEREGNGSVIELKNSSEIETIKLNLRSDQCMLGVDTDQSKHGEFMLKIPSHLFKKKT